MTKTNNVTSTKEIILRGYEFRNLVGYAASLFDLDRTKGVNGGYVDLSTLLIKRKKYDRCLVIATKRVWGLKKEKVKGVLERLGFLLNSDLPPHMVGNLVASEILEVTTMGSQCGCLRFKVREGNARRKAGLHDLFNVFHIFELQHRCIDEFQSCVPILEAQYPRIEAENVVAGEGIWKYRCFVNTQPFFTFFTQLTFRYSYLLHKTHGEEDYEEWFKSLLKKYKWYFEKIALTYKEINKNKYREKFLRLLSEELTGDRQRGGFQDLVFLFKKRGSKPVLLRENPELPGIIEEIMGCLDDEQLKLLDSKDSQENPWSFEDQLKDRFSYTTYPSFASQPEIKEHIRRKIELYKPLITAETAAVIRDILLDDFDKELFVSKATHLGNKEMENNITNLNSKNTSPKVIGAIDRILESIDPSLINSLSLTLEGQTYNLKSLLLARWERAGLAGTKRNFKKHLSSLHIYTIYCPKYGSKETLSMVDLQTFLSEIDSLFLYPRDGRIFKGLGSRNDEGLMIGWRRGFKDMRNSPTIIFSGLLNILLFVMVVFIVFVLIKLFKHP